MILKLENPGYTDLAIVLCAEVSADFIRDNDPWHPFTDQEHQLVESEWFTEPRMAVLVENGLDARALLECLKPA